MEFVRPKRLQALDGKRGSDAVNASVLAARLSRGMRCAALWHPVAASHISLSISVKTRLLTF
jgi:hypothetical protein